MNLTKTQQGISVAAVAAFLFGGGGSLLVWAGDQRYAKNADIDALYEVVEENSVAQQATVASVDVLLHRRTSNSEHVSYLLVTPSITMNKDNRSPLPGAQTSQRPRQPRLNPHLSDGRFHRG